MKLATVTARGAVRVSSTTFLLTANAKDSPSLLDMPIQKGYIRDIKLDGTRFAGIYSWPGAIHEGNGTRQLIVDERATPEHREVVIALESGTQGGANFEIFAALCPNVLETVFAPIDFRIDCERRRAAWSIAGISEACTEPIKNPVTPRDLTF
jgi:hypothetical protein